MKVAGDCAAVALIVGASAGEKVGMTKGEGLMPAWELLDVQRHADLRMAPPRAEGRHFVQVVPAEFARIATRCPILFAKHPDTGRFYAGAVFGFADGENLLVAPGGGLDGAMPLDLERGGFFIADDNIVIDGDHPRFRSAGVPLFEGESQLSESLQRVQRALAGMKHGLEESDRFIETLLGLKLIEPIDIALTFDDGARVELEELYTISRDSLGALDDAAVLALFRGGHLQLAEIMIASLQQIPLLARRRNDRLTLG